MQKNTIFFYLTKHAFKFYAQKAQALPYSVNLAYILVMFLFIFHFLRFTFALAFEDFPFG